LLVPDVLDRLSHEGVGDVPVVVGGIIPQEDTAALREAGVVRVFTPADGDVTGVVAEVADLLGRA
jgi:(2R)-ethylmalonyl-CoA mutase